MSSSVIKEFLVGLGFKIDANSEQKFNAGIKGATAGAVALGNVYADTAEKVVKAVAQMASGLEDLYFMAQRTKASAANIQTLGYAASQMGSSVEGARGSIEALAKFLRENPGGESLIHSIGVQTRDTNGALRDTTDIMVDLGKRLSGMPQYRAIQYANVLGIDYKTLMALEQGVGSFGNRYRDLLRRFGLNVDQATQKSHNLMVAWRDMKTSAGILSTIVGTTLIGVFDELQHRWESLDQVTRDNIKTGAEWVAGIVAGLALVMGGPVVWIAALAAGILALWDDYQVWKEGGKSLIDWGKWEPGITMATNAVKALGSAIEDTFDKMVKLADKVFGGTTAGNWIGEKVALGMAMLGNKEAQAAVGDPAANGGAATRASSGHTPRKGDALGLRSNNPGNLIYNEYTKGLGAIGKNAKGFAIFPDAATGLRAMATNLRNYGRKGVDTPWDIAHRWSKTDQVAYSKKLAAMFGGDMFQHLNLKDPAVIQKLMSAGISMENGRNPYSAEMLAQASGARMGAAGNAGTKIDQTVEVNIHGGGNPHEIEGAVRSGVNGANDRLLRNTRGAAS